METLKEIVEQEIYNTEYKAKKAKEKLDENYVFNFTWGYPGDLYQCTLYANRLKGFLEFISEQPNRTSEWLSSNINQIKRELLRGGYLGTSTNVYHNLAHTYEKEVNCLLLELYEDYLKLISSENKIPIL